MLALHALAALDPADRRVMQEHLVTCAECPADLAGWQGTAGALACLAEPVEPSPQVRNQILESVRAESSNASVAAKAIQLKPNYAIGYYQLGKILRLQVDEGDREETAAPLQRALREQPFRTAVDVDHAPVLKEKLPHDLALALL